MGQFQLLLTQMITILSAQEQGDFGGWLWKGATERANQTPLTPWGQAQAWRLGLEPSGSLPDMLGPNQEPLWRPPQLRSS